VVHAMMSMHTHSHAQTHTDARKLTVGCTYVAKSMEASPATPSCQASTRHADPKKPKPDFMCVCVYVYV
jgi:hypothetical protein